MEFRPRALSTPEPTPEPSPDGTHHHHHRPQKAPGPEALPGSPLPPQAAAILGGSVLSHLPRADHLFETLTPLWPQHLNGEGHLQGSTAAHYPHRLHPTLPQHPQGSFCDVCFLAQKEGLKSSDADPARGLCIPRFSYPPWGGRPPGTAPPRLLVARWSTAASSANGST